MALHVGFCYTLFPCLRIQTASAVLYVMLLRATSWDLTFQQGTAAKDFAFVDFKRVWLQYQGPRFLKSNSLRLKTTEVVPNPGFIKPLPPTPLVCPWRGSLQPWLTLPQRSPPRQEPSGRESAREGRLRARGTTGRFLGHKKEHQAIRSVLLLSKTRAKRYLRRHFPGFKSTFSIHNFIYVQEKLVQPSFCLTRNHLKGNSAEQEGFESYKYQEKITNCKQAGNYAVCRLLCSSHTAYHSYVTDWVFALQKKTPLVLYCVSGNFGV